MLKEMKNLREIQNDLFLNSSLCDKEVDELIKCENSDTFKSEICDMQKKTLAITKRKRPLESFIEEPNIFLQ